MNNDIERLIHFASSYKNKPKGDFLIVSKEIVNVLNQLENLNNREKEIKRILKKIKKKKNTYENRISN